MSTKRLGGRAGDQLRPRLSGAAAIVGGAALVVSASLETAVGAAGNVPGTLAFVVVLGLLTVGSSLLVVATLGAAGFLHGRVSRLGLALLAIVGGAHAIVAVGAVTPLITWDFAGWATASGTVRLAGLVVAAVSAVALSVALWRAATVRSVAVIWLWTLPLLALLGLAAVGLESSLGLTVMWTFVGVQLGTGWLILGYRLLSHGGVSPALGVDS